MFNVGPDQYEIFGADANTNNWELENFDTRNILADNVHI